MTKKYTMKEVKEIRTQTPAEWAGKRINGFIYKQVGYAQKSGANWCYLVYVVYDGHMMRYVVESFGEILA